MNGKTFYRITAFKGIKHHIEAGLTPTMLAAEIVRLNALGWEIENIERYTRLENHEDHE